MHTSLFQQFVRHYVLTNRSPVKTVLTLLAVITVITALTILTVSAILPVLTVLIDKHYLELTQLSSFDQFIDIINMALHDSHY